MFPYLTKLFWVLFSPLSVIVILLVAGFALSFSRFRRLSRWVAGLAIVLLFVVGATNVGALAIRPLERQFPIVAEPLRVDGIVVLGGGMDGELNGANRGWEFNRSGDRFVEALRLALRHPQARVVIAGGIPVLSEAKETEAAAGARFFEAFGIAPDRLLLDDRSRNTEENAIFSKTIAKPQAGETWVLVTSAFHMPRAMGLFRRAGFEVLPWPTDYFTSADEGLAFNPESASDNLAVASVAAREWAGLVGYYLSGKIDQIVPGP